MSLGKVTVWYMTEEERLAYIAKHPIVPTDPKEAKFSTDNIDYEKTNERKKEALKGKTIKDKLDKEKIHKLYMQEGKSLAEIANGLNINASTLSTYVFKWRQVNPEQWTKVKK
jgi:transcriptional regulator with PAS, ATPase and Fis domain